MTEKSGRRANPTRSTLLVGALVLVLSVMGAYSQTDTGETAHWAGRDVFSEKGCVQCHSVYGRGGKDAPDLGERKFYGTYLELATRMWNHFPKMYESMQDKNARLEKMSEEEMEQLISYLSFIRYMGEPGNEYKGQELIEKTCMKCHEFGGRGGDIGPDFVDEKEYMTSMQLVEAMWNHGPDMMDVFEEEHIKRPKFKGNDVANILTAIRGYMKSTRIPPGSFVVGDPANGEALFKEKGCPKCHAIFGIGGTEGSDFGELDFDYSVTQIAGRMWNHGPKMWKIMRKEHIDIPKFKSGEMVHVIAYLYSLKLKDPPGDPKKGEEIVHDKGCLNCHSIRGVGGDVSVDFADLGPLDSPMAIIAGMWNHAPGMREKQLEKKIKWPKLEADEMANLYAYLHDITHAAE